MERVWLDLQGAEVFRRDLLASWAATAAEPRTDDEATAIGRVADQVDDRLVGPQRTAAPVDRDEREQTVLDLVPLAGAWWKVAHVDCDVEIVSESLKLGLPQPRS